MRQRKRCRKMKTILKIAVLSAIAMVWTGCRMADRGAANGDEGNDRTGLLTEQYSREMIEGHLHGWYNKDVPIQDNTEGKVLGAYLMAAVEYERAYPPEAAAGAECRCLRVSISE